MASKNALVGVSLLIAAISACGENGAEPLLTGTTIRAYDPSCGGSCPDKCWSDVYVGMTSVAHVWVFDADQLDEQELRGATHALTVPGDEWDEPIGEFVPTQVPATVYASWEVPSGFELQEQGLASAVKLASGLDTLECGVAYID